VRTRFEAVLLAALLALAPNFARAHDASSWGGLFRSIDNGTSWFSATQGRFMGGALALAISPTDPDRLLLATDGGLLDSRNGGRDWDLVPELPAGPILAVAFDADGRRALAAGRSQVFRSDDGTRWSSAGAPWAGTPRVLVPGAVSGRVYLAAERGLYVSSDWAGTWAAAPGVPLASIKGLIVWRGTPETLVVAVDEQILSSRDGGTSWQRSSSWSGVPDALASDPYRAGVAWAGGTDRLFRSDDAGSTWRAVGSPLPEADTEIRGIAVDETARRLVLATHRGVYGSQDAGQSWTPAADGVPAHLESGLLVADPTAPATLYAGFSLTPYGELRRGGGDGPGLAQLPAGQLAGAAGVLALLAAGAAAWLRGLARARARARAAPARRAMANGKPAP
jgi:photosystem II stability/assembly factor-like uncharacterized protein